MKSLKGDGRRVLRFEKSLRLELSQFLLTGFGHRLPQLTTITRVLAARDLKSARVYISVVGSEKEAEQILAIIDEHRYDFQNHIARTMGLRFCPLLSFYLDTAFEKALKVERILHDLETHRHPNDKGELT